MLEQSIVEPDNRNFNHLNNTEAAILVRCRLLR
jgi:hypothetical protein